MLVNTSLSLLIFVQTFPIDVCVVGYIALAQNLKTNTSFQTYPSLSLSLTLSLSVCACACESMCVRVRVCLRMCVYVCVCL